MDKALLGQTANPVTSLAKDIDQTARAITNNAKQVNSKKKSQTCSKFAHLRSLVMQFRF